MSHRAVVFNPMLAQRAMASHQLREIYEQPQVDSMGVAAPVPVAVPVSRRMASSSVPVATPVGPRVIHGRVTHDNSAVNTAVDTVVMTAAADPALLELCCTCMAENPLCIPGLAAACVTGIGGLVGAITQCCGSGSGYSRLEGGMPHKGKKGKIPAAGGPDPDADTKRRVAVRKAESKHERSKAHAASVRADEEAKRAKKEDEERLVEKMEGEFAEHYLRINPDLNYMLSREARKGEKQYEDAKRIVERSCKAYQEKVLDWFDKTYDEDDESLDITSYKDVCKLYDKAHE